MTDRYERIRAALAMGPTPGPWLVCPTNSGVFVKSERVSGYLAEARHCRTTQDVRADANLISACDPDTIRELLAERDALAAEIERLAEALRKLEEREQRDEALRLADECEESAQAWANEIDTRQRAAAELRRLHVQAAQGEALLRQALEVLSRAHQTAMEQTLKARIPECAEFAGIAKDLGFVVTALRERLGVKA